MFLLSDLFSALADLTGWVLEFCILVVLIRAVLSWVDPDPFNPLVRAIHAVSEPFLAPFRKLLPPWRLNGLDLSPLLAIISLAFVKRFLVSVLWDLANRFHG